VFLFWNGRSEEVTNAILPFHCIEHIDEPRKEKQAERSIFDLDDRGRQLKGWTNKLIWGDNKLILSSLVNGPLKEEIEKEGGVKLIYIDPPFAVGADFSFDIKIDGDEITKKPSIIEEIAYRDTWGRGISSYLAMMYERLKLIHNLLANDGSIYVHCDYRVNAYLRLILDDIFGKENFRNEIAWRRGRAVTHTTADQFSRMHDVIWFFIKSERATFNRSLIPYAQSTLKMYRYQDNRGFYRLQELRDYSEENIKKFKKENRIHEKNGKLYLKQYLEEKKGVAIDDLWSDIGSVSYEYRNENLDFPTQKPEALLNRIIKASSNEGDLVADFFCGSGTTCAVAEKLGRKWICADLGRFAIHTTRKRMIEMQRRSKRENKPYRAFEILNLGKYERKYFLGINTDLPEQEQQKQLEQKQEQYINLILEGYKAKRIEGFKILHGQKAQRFVYVGPIDFPVTKAIIDDIYKECQEKLITNVDALGFEFEMGLHPYVEQEMKDVGIDLKLKNNPREVLDRQAVEKGQVKFYDVAYLEVEPIVKDKTVKVKLKDFITSFTQDDLEEIEQSMKAGSNKVVIEHGNIVKLTKDKDGVLKREVLTKKWADWIDYWAIDFDYQSKKEIIRIKRNGETEEVWTGNYIFENEWQSFRTKKNLELELTSTPHTYEQPGKYKIAVRVVDILGQDTLQTIDMNIG
jgi:adenine-specific DNA-methyltransferase